MNNNTINNCGKEAISGGLFSNSFGSGKIDSIEDVDGSVYFTCSACMSVLADALSWANANENRIVKTPEESENIVVLSCQVTDLAILSDFRVIENLMNKYKNKRYFISGCLAQRFDIQLPENVERLKTPDVFSRQIKNKQLVNFEKPFWVKEFNENNDDLSQGNIFRNMYPFRLSRGCKYNCTYCTIKITRGEYTENEPTLDEFINNDNILLIADSPTVEQLKYWIGKAIEHNKVISIRNVEPHVTSKIECELILLAEKKLLKIFHSPIQSNHSGVLMDMNRSINATNSTIRISTKLKEMGVKIATNIIIDYKKFKQDFTDIYDLYDYVSWNPLWDGKWDRSTAEHRFEKYSDFFGVGEIAFCRH